MKRIIHIGRKVPKDFEELPGGIHLGKGIWMLPMKLKSETKKKVKL